MILNNYSKTIVSLFSIFVFVLSGCNNSKDDIYLERPEDTNLEFWITQRTTANEFDDKGCTVLPGWMGATEYLDSRYTAIEDGDMVTAPDIHVTYLVTGYPDCLDNAAVTRIQITDPAITVYGLTINSSEKEISDRLSDISKSFSYVTTTYECYPVYRIKNCSFSFMSDKIVIAVPVTNKRGIVF